jgi:thiol-disulfide isomerase/thioredoxin
MRGEGAGTLLQGGVVHAQEARRSNLTTLSLQEVIMKRTQIDCLIVIGIFFLMLSPGLVSATSPPQKGDLLPEMNLPIPEDPAHRSYLGLTGQGLFQIPQIKAQVVLVEIFSMYCPVCQREAPRVNALYKNIEANPKSKGKIKIIGIGAGNSPFEVNVFRENTTFLFPCSLTRILPSISASGKSGRLISSGSR